MYKSWRILPLIALLAGLVGCAGGRSSTGQSTVITVNNSFHSIQAGSSPVTLQAVDPTGAPLSVSWALTYSLQPCSPDCGTLTLMGTSVAVYTPPAFAPQYGAGTLTVRSEGDVWVGDFQIRHEVHVEISPKFSQKLAGGPSAFLTANVSNDEMNTGVTWSLTASGANCAPTCGTLTPSTGPPPFTATYAPPDTVPAGANALPTIGATSNLEPAHGDSFLFSIVSSKTLLHGQYTLLLRGYYLGSSAPMAIAGTIAADGNGNITDGEFDINNDGAATLIASPVTGIYSIDIADQGFIRGRIEITSFKFPGSNIDIAFDFTLSLGGTRGRVVESDGSAFINSGTIFQQPSAVTMPDNSYAFELDSDAPIGGRIVEEGQLTFGAGGTTQGIMDRSQAGAPFPIYSGVQLSPGTLTAPDALGRGTLTINAPAVNVPPQAPIPSESVQYAYYIVNSGQFNLIEIDNGKTTGVQAGVAYAQKIPSKPDTISVLQLTGMDAVPGCTSGPCVGPDVIIGVLNIANNTFSLTFDENDLGNVFPPAVVPNVTPCASARSTQQCQRLVTSGTVNFDSGTGRGTLSDPGGFENDHFVDSAVFYMYDAGKGFLIDADISTCVISTSPCSPAIPPSSPGPITNVAFSGTFVPQAIGPFHQSDIDGHLILGSGASAIPDIPDIEAPVIADGAAGAYDTLGDVDSLPSQDGNLRNYDFGGSYSIGNVGNAKNQTADESLGYGVATVPSFVLGQFNPPSNPPAAFYMIGPNQFVLIGKQSGIYSGVSFFDPQ